jgi:predicted transcriptional regulator
MPQISISDQLYQKVLQLAKSNGFDGADDYVSDLLEQAVAEPENFDEFFTPQRLAEIKSAIAQVEAGESLTAQVMREHFGRKSES